MPTDITAPNISDHINDPSIDSGSEVGNQLFHGQEVYLTYEGKKIMKAKYNNVVCSDTCTSSGMGSFIVRHVFKSVVSWKKYDPCTMVKGSKINWKIENIVYSKIASVIHT